MIVPDPEDLARARHEPGPLKCRESRFWHGEVRHVCRIALHGSFETEYDFGVETARKELEFRLENRVESQVVWNVRLASKGYGASEEYQDQTTQSEGEVSSSEGPTRLWGLWVGTFH